MTLRGILAAIVIGGTVSSPAHAGTYEVKACGDSAGRVNHAWKGTYDSSRLEIGQSCEAAGSYAGLYARDRLCTGTCTLPVSDARAAWTFEAPTGTRVVGVSYTRWLFKRDDDDWIPALSTADGFVLETCHIVYPASGCDVGTAGGTRASFDVPATGSLTVGVHCRPNPSGNCSAGATLHGVSAVLYGATVTLTDEVQPSLNVTGGSLFDGGYVGGRRGVLFDAADNAGIRSARVYVDGVAQPAVTYSCDFTYTVPCSDRSNASLEIDTSTFGDGVHEVEVAVTDAASNETRSGSRTITVDNDAPKAPTGLVVASQNGDNFDIAWTNPAGQVAPIVAARWELCDSTGIRCTSGEQPGAGIDRLTGIRVPGTGEWQLRVHLEDGAGHYSQRNSAGVTLRYGSPATAGEPTTVTATEPPPPAPAPAPDALIAPIDPAAPFIAVPTALRAPDLTVTSYRLVRGRIVIRGRSAAGLATARFRTDRRLVTVQRKLRGGAFVLRIRARRLPRLVTLRHLGSATHLPQTVRVRRHA